MAIIYVRSTDGSDADDGSTWALAKASISGALAIAAAGDLIAVSQNHSVTVSALTDWILSTNPALPIIIACVDDSAEPPTTLATGASLSVSGNFSFTINGFGVLYGLTIVARTTGTGVPIAIGNNVSYPAGLCFHNCTLGPGAGFTANAGVHVGVYTNGADDQRYIFRDCTFYWRHVNNRLVLTHGNTTFINCTNDGTAVPNTLVWAADGFVELNGCDFSYLSGSNLITTTASKPGKLKVRNCKLPASITLFTGTLSGPGDQEVELVNCDSADTNYMYYYQNYMGVIQQETTIVRTGGASDGTTPISREMISSANATKAFPLILSDLVAWNETTGSSVTLTVHVVTDNVTLTDQECWLEVEYLGTSGYPWSLSVDDADNITDRLLGGSASNQTTSTETWTTTGLTTPVKQQLSVSVTPQEKGPIRCRVVLAKASTTVYVCPKVECDSVTEGRTYQVGPEMYIIEPSTSGGGGGGPLISGRLVR